MSDETKSAQPKAAGPTITIHVDTTELDEAIAKAEKLNQLLDKAIAKAEKLKAIMDSIKMPKRHKKHPTQEILEQGGIVSGEEFDEMIRDEKIQDAVDERLAEVFGFKPSDPKLLES